MRLRGWRGSGGRTFLPGSVEFASGLAPVRLTGTYLKLI